MLDCLRETGLAPDEIIEVRPGVFKACGVMTLDDIDTAEELTAACGALAQEAADLLTHVDRLSLDGVTTGAPFPTGLAALDATIGENDLPTFGELQRDVDALRAYVRTLEVRRAR